MTAVCAEQQAGPSLCEVLDRLLAKGAVLDGDLVISVAGVDLVVIRLKLLIASAAALPRGAP